MKKRHLFLFLMLGLVFVNSCQKEHSLESGNGPSEGTLQDDGTGNCLPKTVNGAYVVGVALVGTINYIEVQVDVTTVGNFTIYTDTVNGMYFRVSGIFTTTGLNTVRLKGFGTPAAVGITNFVINYGTSACTIAVTTVASLAVFTLDGAPGGCMGATPAGTYTAGTILDASNTVTISVNVTTAGAYNISTIISNGMTFSGFGTLATGMQTIILTGAGTPIIPGPANVQVAVASSSCSFIINVGGTVPTASYTVDCSTAAVQGTYIVGTVLNPATNKVLLTVNVLTAGTYNITATSPNGITFNASGTFASAGAGQSVTLVASSTSNPTTPNANTIQLTGGTANCSFTVNVNPSGNGAALFTVDCSSATLNGYLTKGVPVAPVNTITIDVNVTTPGTYTITTTTVNNITYTASGTFPAAVVTTVTLTGTGTPANSGPFTLNIPNANPACGIDIDVDPNYGMWSFKVGTTTYSGTIYDAYFDNTLVPAPATAFIILGDDAAGNLFEIDLIDVNGTIVSAETYKCAPPVTGNAAGLYYSGVTGTTYEADPVTTGLETNTVTVTVISHNAAAKTMTGTFSGNALLNGTATLANIQMGTFNITYP